MAERVARPQGDAPRYGSGGRNAGRDERCVGDLEDLDAAKRRVREIEARVVAVEDGGGDAAAERQRARDGGPADDRVGYSLRGPGGPVRQRDSLWPPDR